MASPESVGRVVELNGALVFEVIIAGDMLRK